VVTTLNGKPVIKIVVLLVILVAIGWTIYSAVTKDKQPQLATGKPAPDFVAKDLTGKDYRLSELKGKGIILNFWGTWCEPCREEMPALQEMSEKLKDQGVLVLAVNNGESEVAVKAFAKQYGLTFPILLDKRLDIAKAYQVNPLPTTFFIKHDGTMVLQITGPMNVNTILDNAKKIAP
jgi:peroxiredoxin